MGGGKTHNLLALGLLAKHHKLRQEVMGSFHDLTPLGAVRVVAINGRDPDTKSRPVGCDRQPNSTNARHSLISTVPWKRRASSGG